jgi:hypothetical protein
MSTTLALLQTAAEAKNTAAAGSAGFAYGLTYQVLALVT